MNIQISRRDVLLGSGALVVSFSLGRPVVGSAGASRRQAGRAHRSRFLPRHRQGRQRHGLFRQGRSRHRRHHGAAPDRGGGARRADRPHRVDPGRHLAHARPGQHLGQPHHPARRHAAAASIGRRAPGADGGSGEEARHRPAHRHRRRDFRRRQERQLRRVDRRQELLRSSSIPKQPAKEKAPKDYKIVGKSQPRVDIPAQDHRPLHLHAGLQGARHVARPRGAAAGDRRQARKRG